MRSINQKMTKTIRYHFSNFYVTVYNKTSKNVGSNCACCKEIKIKTTILDKTDDGDITKFVYLCKKCTGQYSLHLRNCKKRRMGFALLKMKGIL